MFKNLDHALGEVSASIVGSVGIVFLIATVVSAQNDATTAGQAFQSYFAGGQIGLSILSISGVAFVTLLRHNPTRKIIGVLFWVFLIGPIIATSIFIGLNPGFNNGGLNETVLLWLWLIYGGLHLLWLLVLLFEPALPSAQEVGAEQKSRVEKMKQGAKDRG